MHYKNINAVALIFFPVHILADHIISDSMSILATYIASSNNTFTVHTSVGIGDSG